MLTAKMRFGIFPSRAMTWSLATASSFPTMSATLVGLNFSTHGISGPTAGAEDDDEAINDSTRDYSFTED